MELSNENIRILILPKDCNKCSGGFFKGNIWCPKTGFYYGKIKHHKSEERGER